MNESPARLTFSTVVLCLLAGSALAQSAPLALPPPAADAPPVVISAPNGAAGLALPPPVQAVLPPQVPAQAPAAIQPVATAQPVEATPLGEVKADSIGLLANGEGGLGAGLWKGTSRAFVERMLPMMSLPSPFASLNNLAQRFLLTTAGAPDGSADKGSGQTLTSLRVDKLVSLGNADEAWKLASVAPADQIDDIGLRQVAEMALISSASADVCARLPAIIQKHTSIEWQKLLLVCQLQAKDTKAAQVSLDLLHAQDVHDDSFFALAEKNIIAGSPQLPRQMTPLKPLNLALARLTDLPLRAEVYAHPEAPIVPELLKAKAVDENARIALAERSAAKGLLSAAALEDIYRSQVFSPDVISNANIGGEQGPKLRALLYQASQLEKSPKNRINEALKFQDSLDASLLNGNMLPLLATMLGDIQPTADFYANAVSVANIYLLAGKTSNAQAWLASCRDAARGMPQVAAQLQSLWPLIALSGLESEKDFPQDLEAWIGATIRDPTQQDGDMRAKKATTSAILLLLDAVGFSVSDEAWEKTADSALYEKVAMPPTLILERLRASAAANHKGGTILMGLLATNSGGKDEPSLLAVGDTVRALRLIGLPNDAGNLAKEAAIHILNAPAKP